MDKHQDEDAGPAGQERDEPGEVPLEAAQDSVPAEEPSPDEAGAADADRAPDPDATAAAQVPDSADLPETK